MKKIISYYKQWDRWQKHNVNSRFYKILVFLGVTHSPTFELMKAINSVRKSTRSLNMELKLMEEEKI